MELLPPPRLFLDRIRPNRDDASLDDAAAAAVAPDFCGEEGVEVLMVGGEEEEEGPCGLAVVVEAAAAAPVAAGAADWLGGRGGAEDCGTVLVDDLTIVGCEWTGYEEGDGGIPSPLVMGSMTAILELAQPMVCINYARLVPTRNNTRVCSLQKPLFQKLSVLDGQLVDVWYCRLAANVHFFVGTPRKFNQHNPF